MWSLVRIDDVQAKTLKRDQGDQGKKEKTSVVRKSMSPYLGRKSSTHFLQSTCYMDNQFVAEKLDDCCPLQQDDEVVSEQRTLDLSRFVPTALNGTLSGGFWSEIGKLGQTDGCPEDISIGSPVNHSPQVPATSHGSVCDNNNSPKPNSSGNSFQQNASGELLTSLHAERAPAT